MGMETMDIPVETGHHQIMKKLMSYDNGRNRETGIVMGGGIRSRRYGSKAVSGQERPEGEDELYNGFMRESRR